MATPDQYETVTNDGEHPQFFEHGGQVYIFHPHPRFKKGWFKLVHEVEEEQKEYNFGKDKRILTRRIKTQRLVPDKSRPGHGPHSHRCSFAMIDQIIKPAANKPLDSHRSSAKFVYQEELLDAVLRGADDIRAETERLAAERDQQAAEVAKLQRELAELKALKEAALDNDRDAAVAAALAKVKAKTKE
jgi:hypothetical protein